MCDTSQISLKVEKLNARSWIIYFYCTLLKFDPADIGETPIHMRSPASFLRTIFYSKRVSTIWRWIENLKSNNAN